MKQIQLTYLYPPQEDNAPWRYRTLLEERQGFYSDWHKDLYGRRPRFMTHEQWNSKVWLKKALADLEAAAPAIHAQEEAEEKEAIAAVEQRIADAITFGAVDRAEGIRWLLQAEDCEDDPDHACFRLGIPFGYLSLPKLKEAA